MTWGVIEALSNSTRFSLDVYLPIAHELETLELLVSVHPLTAILSQGKSPKTVPAKDLEQWVGRRVWVLGWLVARKEVRTKEGDPMEFVSFEDETALFEAFFFPQVFRRTCQLLDRDQGYLLCGRVEREFGAVSLTVAQVQPL